MLAVCVLFPIALPFGRRDDWIGWIAFSVVAGITIGIWALLIRGMALNKIRWWRDRSARSGNVDG
jgi:hypothetical protein